MMIADDRCRTNINRHISRIKAMFKWAVSCEMLPAGVFQSLLTVEGLKRRRSGAKESYKVKPVPIAHVQAVLPRVSR